MFIILRKKNGKVQTSPSRSPLFELNHRRRRFSLALLFPEEQVVQSIGEQSVHFGIG